MNVQLRSHQLDALSKMKNGSILYGGVGSGKSLTAAAYYVQHHSTRPVFVITTARKRDSLDWLKEFAKYAVGTTPESTIAGVLTVDSWNNIGKYVRCKDAFFIFDEQRLVGSGGWVKSFLKIAKHNSWMLLSGTPGDTWLEYIPVFLAHGFFASRTEFKALHVAYKPFSRFPVVDHYMNVGKLVRLRNSIMVHMPYERLTTRRSIRLPVEYDKFMSKQATKTLWNPFKDSPMTSASELCGVLRRIVNRDPSRFRALKETLKEHKRVIVFYNFNYELDILRGLAGIKIAEWNGQKHEEVPETESWVYLVQYQAGAEAWECITTNVVFFYSPTYSYKIWEQAHGRIDRLNTSFVTLLYYSPTSSAPIEVAIRRALDSKKTFNEFDLPYSISRRSFAKIS